MRLSNHSELIAVVTELWTLLDDLAAIEHGRLYLPLQDIEVHPASIFDSSAALAAGFSSEAVAVMSALPYLHTGCSHVQAMELRGSTFPTSYLELDEGGFESTREIYEDENERMIEPSAFRLTEKNVYGWDDIYDTEIRMVYPWNAWDDDGEKWYLHDKPIYSHVQPVPPREAFQPLIDSFRQLTRLAGPEVGLVETDESSPDCFGPRYPDEARIGELKLYEADLRVWKAQCTVAEIYLECGWDVDLITQTHFRRAEFLEKRAKHLSEVVEPLRKERDKAVEFFQEHYRDHVEL